MNANKTANAKPSFTVRTLLIALFATALGACGESGSGTSLNDAPLAREAPPTSQDFGDYVIHFNATTSDLLSQADAAKYKISRSRSNALLNVVLLKKSGVPGHTPVSGNVSVQTNNLTGQTKKVALQEIVEGDAIYFIGVVPVTHKETLNFKIAATPADSTNELEVKFQQQFFTK